MQETCSHCNATVTDKDPCCETHIAIAKQAKPLTGVYLQPELWSTGNILKAGLTGFCDYYLPVNSRGPIKHVAVNVKVTGQRPVRRYGDYSRRVMITFVGDGEPDTFSKGWIPYVQG